MAIDGFRGSGGVGSKISIFDVRFGSPNHFRSVLGVKVHTHRCSPIIPPSFPPPPQNTPSPTQTSTPASTHSSGTPSLHPLASLTHFTKTGFAFSTSGGVASASEPAPAPLALSSAAESLPRRLGACFLRRRLIVSICASGES